jgi:ribosomal-protein-alanine N-acetyltransferase
VAAKVLIRPPSPADARAFLTAARASRALHRPWVRAPDTPAKFRAFLALMEPPAHYSFLVCRRDTGAIVGVINVSNVVRGALRSGYLGYYVFAGHARQGLMRLGLRTVIRHAFKTLKLHRLEANIQPNNAASLALAAACGLRKEGFSPRYLKIGGRWRDHERWALLVR